MRRMVFLLAALGFVVVGATPAGADRVQKSSYVIAECPAPDNPQAPPERMWYPTDDTVQVRGITNLYYEYLYDDGEWVGPIGTNTTVANAAASFPEFEGTFWGTWSFADDDGGPDLGNIEGTWVFTDHGAAKATGMADDGTVVKVALGLDQPVHPLGCSVTEFVLFEK